MEVRSWTELPLCTARCAARLMGEDADSYALTYTVTVPELEETSAYLACYDEAGVMLALNVLPDAALTGRDTIALSNFFAPFDVSNMRRFQLFLLESNTFRPVCEHWTGNLSA